MSKNRFDMLDDYADPPSPEFKLSDSKLRNLSSRIVADHAESGWNPSDPLDQLADAMGGLDKPSTESSMKISFDSLIDSLPGVSAPGSFGASTAWDFDSLLGDMPRQPKQSDRQTKKILEADKEDNWEDLLDQTSRVRRLKEKVKKIKSKVKGKATTDRTSGKVSVANLYCVAQRSRVGGSGSKNGEKTSTATKNEKLVLKSAVRTKLVSYMQHVGDTVAYGGRSGCL